MNMNNIYGVYSYNLKPSTVKESISPNSVKLSDEKDKKTSNPDDMLNAINAQGLVNKPLVTTTNELTFGDNGTIVADRRKMTLQNGKVQFGKPVFISLPIDRTLSLEDTKEKYINTMLSNSKNILNCIFLVKDSDGTDVQVAICSDKKDPYKLTVSTRKDINSEFEEDTVNTFNQSIGSADDAIKTLILTELEKYGLENLKQIAIADKN